MSRPLRSQTIVDYILSDIFTSEEKWIKGSMAENKSHKIVGIHSEKAICWCLEGAIQKAAVETRIINESLDDDNKDEYAKISDEIFMLLEPKLKEFDFLTEFNDNEETTFNDIIETLNYGSNVYYR